MHIPDLKPNRSHDLGHHLAQANAWLAASNRGAFSTALSYAAFEIRLAAERICLQYYVKLVGSKAAKTKPQDLKFKAMKARIFESAGNQKRIDAQFEFTRAFLRVLGVEAKAPTPNIGRLHAIWSDCSEACHIFWNVSADTGKWPASYKPHADLAAYIAELDELTRATATWLRIQDAGIDSLREQFIADGMSDDALRDALSDRGAFAAITTSEGKRKILGTPIPPKQDNKDDA